MTLLIIRARQSPTALTDGLLISKVKPQPQFNAPMQPMTIQQQDDNEGWIMPKESNNESAPVT